MSKQAIIDALAPECGGRLGTGRTSAKGAGPDSSMEVAIKYLILTIRKPTFDPAFRDAHFAFLADLRARGLLEQAGPFTDRTGGAYILVAEGLDEARRLAEGDPLNVHNCSTVTVHEWDSV